MLVVIMGPRLWLLVSVRRSVRHRIDRCLHYSGKTRGLGIAFVGLVMMFLADDVSNGCFCWLRRAVLYSLLQLGFSNSLLGHGLPRRRSNTNYFQYIIAIGTDRPRRVLAPLRTARARLHLEGCLLVPTGRLRSLWDIQGGHYFSLLKRESRSGVSREVQ